MRVPFALPKRYLQQQQANQSCLHARQKNEITQWIEVVVVVVFKSAIKSKSISSSQVHLNACQLPGGGGRECTPTQKDRHTIGDNNLASNWTHLEGREKGMMAIEDDQGEQGEMQVSAVKQRKRPLWFY